MTDLVYPIGTGSTWNNNELKYSLRSVDKHLKNVGKIYLIGENVPFITDINHVPFVETANNHNQNILEKVLRACDLPELSEDFLFMNDDHFLLRDFNLPNFPNYQKGTLEEYKPKNNGWYLADLMWTQDKLRKEWFFHAEQCGGDFESITYAQEPINFDTHTPIMYNKTRFKERLGNLEPVGILIKSMYAAGLPNVFQKDCKLYRRHTTAELQAKTKDAPCFSISDRAINDELLKFLNYLYPTKSRWEELKSCAAEPH